MEFDLIGRQVIRILLDLAVKSTLLMAVGFMAARLFARTRPAWSSLVWSGMMAALLLMPPASLLLPGIRVPILPSSIREKTGAAPLPPPGLSLPFSASAPFPGVSGSPPRVVLPPEEEAETAAFSLPSVPAAPAPSYLSRLAPAVALLYLAGLGFTLLWMGIGLWRMRRLVRTGLPFEEGRERLAHWRHRLGVKTPVRLRISDRLHVPALIGLWRPVIVFPKTFEASAPGKAMDAVLIHELAHVRRRDMLWNLLGRIALAVYWYHPLAHLTCRRLTAAREEACDDWAVAALGDAKGYAAVLLDVVAHLHRRPAFSWSIGMAHAPDILDRIDRILTLGGRVSPRVGRVAAACSTVTLLLCSTLLGSLRAVQHPSPEAAAALYRTAVEASARFHFNEAIAALHEVIETDPAYPAAHLRLADIYTHPWSRDPVQAGVHLSEVDTTRTPLSLSDRLYFAAMRAKAGNRMKEAIEAMRARVRQDSTSLEARFDLAELLYWNGLSSEARAAYKRVLALDPDYAPALNHLALTYQVTREYDRGLPLLERAVALEPGEPNWRDSLGDLYRYEGKENRAVVEYEKAVYLRPDFYVAWQKLGNIFQRRGRDDEAIEAYTRATRHAPTPAARAALLPALWGLRLKRDGEREETRQGIARELAALTAADSHDPASMEAIARGYRMIGRNDRADALLEELVVQQPEGQKAQMIKVNHAMQTKDSRVQTRLLESFLDEFPESAMRGLVYYTLFRAYAKTGNVARIRALADDVLATPFPIQPRSALPGIVAAVFADYGIDLGRAETLARESAEGGESYFRRAVRPPSLSVQAWEERKARRAAWRRDVLGWVYVKQGKLAEAERLLSNARRLLERIHEAPSPALLFHIGTLYARQGRMEEAAAMYRRSLAAPGGSEGARSALAALYEAQGKSKAEIERLLAELRSAAREHEMQRLVKTRLDRPAPDFSLRDLDGKPVRLGALRGKVVLLYYWATWCAPSRWAMPHYQRIYEEYKEKGAAFLTISIDDVSTRKEVRPYVEKAGYAFPVLYDEGTLQKLKGEGVGTLFILDPSGRIQYKHIGYGREQLEEIRRQIEALLDEG